MADTTASDEATNGRRSTLPDEFLDEWRDVAYNCFSSGHKFCREVCPVMQVTRDERHTPTAFHANVVAMEKGHLTLEDVADDYMHCTMCGACELRCPNTLFTGDFYRFRQRTIDVVKAMRALAVQERDPSEELAALGGADRPVGQRAGARLDAGDLRQQGAGVGGGPRSPDRWRDGAVRGLRGGVQAALGAARGRAVAASVGGRVRVDGPAVVLRRPDVGDGLRRRRSQDGRAQHARLAQDGHEADHLPGPARLHHDHRALSGARSELRRVRGRARGRSDRRGDPGGQAEADHAGASGRSPTTIRAG